MDEYHTIEVISIPNLFLAKDNIDKDNTLVIQIQHTGKNEYDIIKLKKAKVIGLEFDDVYKGKDGFITPYQVGYVYGLGIGLSLRKNPLRVIVSCYGGLSRSPAIASALYIILFKETKDSYYGFRSCDIRDCYQHQNTDILSEIDRLLNNKDNEEDI